MPNDDTASRRVALVAHRLSTPHASGVDRYGRELALALNRLRPPMLDVVIASPPEAEEATWLPPGLVAHRIAAPRRALHFAWSAVGRPRVERFLGPVDLVHVLTAAVPVPSRARVIYTVHDLSPIDEPTFFARRERWGFRRALDDAVRRAHSIVCDSAYVAAEIASRCDVSPDRIAVIPLGVADFFRRPIDAGARAEVVSRFDLPERYLLFVGAINARKNLVTVLRALARRRPAPLVLAGGRGLGADVVEAEVARLGLTDTVRFVGYVEDGLLPALMQGALGLVHPGANEGFGFTPLEAMTVGTPAAVAAAGSLPELVGDAAIQVGPDDVDGWDDAVVRLADDAALRRRLADAGRARAGRFTWDATATATATLYRDALYRDSKG